MSDSDVQIIYEIDKYNVIRRIAGSWDEFCDENQTRDLAIDRVVGTSLWDFVIGKDVRWLYEKILHHVRSGKQPLQFPFRCDSPETIRLMEMDVSPEYEDGVRFVTRPLEIRSRPKHVYYNYVSHGQRCHVFSCSICNRVKRQDAWLQLEEALMSLRLLDNDKPLSLYGALCPDCKVQMESMLATGSCGP